MSDPHQNIAHHHDKNSKLERRNLVLQLINSLLGITVAVLTIFIVILPLLL